MKMRKDGLTHEEGVVMDHLTAAVVAFKKLERQHPSEGFEFTQGIHKCTSLMAVRLARSTHPEGWPVIGPPRSIPSDPGKIAR